MSGSVVGPVGIWENEGLRLGLDVGPRVGNGVGIGEDFFFDDLDDLDDFDLLPVLSPGRNLLCGNTTPPPLSILGPFLIIPLPVLPSFAEDDAVNNIMVIAVNRFIIKD